uniref:DUF1618 domain-containing protein n=1 Tax=Setaria viridis TaxID=4556 RepID=A0A4U6V1R5_SETVI|nr:LOW QUALITY PROTEIN: hypothetical protein SEVIR_4G264100v2 [Setaria viridis]
MPKRRRCGERDGGSTAEPRRPHLYLVCDDWDSGYSIRKFPLPADSGEGAEQGLPKLFRRVTAPREFPQHFTSAFGTKIMGMHHNDSGAVQIIDVRTRSVLFGPEPNYPAYPIYFPVGGDRLFALDSGCFDLCRFPPEQPDSESDGDGSSLDESDAGSDFDSNGKWSWHQLPVPPFARMDVTSYAMHPDGDGHTILVSTKSGEEEATATFSFETGVFVWKNLGEWTLPFTGRGHYESELRALVGLSKDPETFGYLYACDVPSTGNRHCPAPAWKRSKEKVFSKNPADRRVSASLIYLGYRRKFCLVECVLVEEGNSCQVKEDKADQVLLEKPEGAGVPQRSATYRLMTFSLKYDKMDDIRVRQRRVRYYKLL